MKAEIHMRASPSARPPEAGLDPLGGSARSAEG
jgi:hypothetical protein